MTPPVLSFDKRERVNRPPIFVKEVEMEFYFHD